MAQDSSETTAGPGQVSTSFRPLRWGLAVLGSALVVGGFWSIVFEYATLPAWMMALVPAAVVGLLLGRLAGGPMRALVLAGVVFGVLSGGAGEFACTVRDMSLAFDAEILGVLQKIKDGKLDQPKPIELPKGFKLPDMDDLDVGPPKPGPGFPTPDLPGPPKKPEPLSKPKGAPDGPTALQLPPEVEKQLQDAALEAGHFAQGEIMKTEWGRAYAKEKIKKHLWGQFFGAHFWQGWLTLAISFLGTLVPLSFRD